MEEAAASPAWIASVVKHCGHSKHFLHLKKILYDVIYKETGYLFLYWTASEEDMLSKQCEQ